MIDCDNNDTTGWRPSRWVAVKGLSVANLTITNFDEDHVGDLPALRPYVETYTVNWTVPTAAVRRAKAVDGVGRGVATALSMVDTADGIDHAIDWGLGFEVKRFCHRYGTFYDENSLSVVTFVRYGDVRIVLPGDLTEAGWKLFLQRPDFLLYLYSTRIFVASHHGREDGYYPEMFRLWTPDVVIVSDKRIMHESQIVNYGAHAKGLNWADGTIKRCLTTRRNGDIVIRPTLGGFRIETRC
jgi:beta-lactamase superfamily II metal-dependent hydrolase